MVFCITLMVRLLATFTVRLVSGDRRGNLRGTRGDQHLSGRFSAIGQTFDHAYLNYGVPYAYKVSRVLWRAARGFRNLMTGIEVIRNGGSVSRSEYRAPVFLRDAYMPNNVF